MNQKRPINLNLFTISFPIPAIISILHRITGVVLFLIIPFVLWLWEYSLSPEGFNHLKLYFSYPSVKLFTLLLMIPIFFHFVAGIRHLLMDIHIGETLEEGRYSARWTFIFTIFLLILVGVWLW